MHVQSANNGKLSYVYPLKKLGEVRLQVVCGWNGNLRYPISSITTSARPRPSA